MLKPLILALTLAAAPLAAMGRGAPSFWAAEFPLTDFARTSIDFAEVMSGGPPRDGIPALSDPQFVATADAGLGAREPVVTLEIAGETPRAYPLRYLTWHEIVNDRVGGVPVAVTFCPLCNSAVVFDRRVGGRELTFGVTGKLRNSDMLMYDHQTESWWQQFTGTGVVGALTGVELARLPAWVEGFAAFAERNPEGAVMAEPTGHARAYGRNPYVDYDQSNWPFLYRGERPPHGIEPLARVVSVEGRAWPLERLAEAGEITEAGLRLSWTTGAASALGAAKIAEARDIGAVRVRDASTGADVPHDVGFAFAFHAFHPDGAWMLGD